MTTPVGASQAQRPASEAELLSLLGLGSGASNNQIEAAHDEILDFLAEAPASLRTWASQQIVEADEAYAQLNGAPASASLAASPIVQAQAMVARAKRADRHDPRPAFDDGFDGDVFDDGFDGPTGGSDQAVAVRQHERQRGPARSATANMTTGITINVATARRGGLIGGLVVAIAALVFGVYTFGQPAVPGVNGTPAPRASGGLDTAAVAADMAKLATNANDIATLQDLADLYYAAEDFTTAQSWLQKILDIEPGNIAALLGYGAAAYNLGDLTTAEARWRAVLAIDAKNIEAHYDLGFLYFSSTPPNVEGVKAEWNAVLALNPDSDLKAYIEAHLASLSKLESAQPAGSPGASPAPSTAPAVSPSAS